MRILERYLGMTLVKSTLMALMVFIGLEMFILLATQINTMGKGSYTLWQAFLYVLLTLPQQTYALFPMAGLLGMLFGLGMLANHSELIVMRASGVSPMQILRYAMTAGIILIILVVFMGEFLAPAARHLAEKRKLLAVNTGQVLKTQQGLWLRQDNNFYYIQTIYSAHHIANVSRYEFNARRQLLNASFAADGRYENGLWQMQNIQESDIKADQVTTKTVPHAGWYLALNPHLLKISLSQPDEMSLKQLAEFIHYQKENRLSATASQIAFWQRALQPLACLIMMFLAVPFIFGPLRSATTGLRLMLGVLTGFAFYICNQLFPPLSQVFNLPPFLAVMLPLLLFAAAGLLLLRRVR